MADLNEAASVPMEIDGLSAADAAAQRLVERVTSRLGYTSAMGTEVAFVRRGQVHLRLAKRPDLLQFNGHFHGGVIAGLADHAAGGAVTTAMPAGRTAVTIDLHLTFIAPADGQTLLAKARAVKVGATVCVAQVDVVTGGHGGERLAAIATVTLRAVDTPS